MATLTKEDIRLLESMFIVSMHEAEIIIRTIEGGLTDMYKQSKDYRKLTNIYGQTNADQIVKATVHEELNKEETYAVGQLLQECRKLHYWMDRLTSAGIAVKPGIEKKAEKEMEKFDALMHDAKLLAWRHAMMCNIPMEKDIQLDTTIKLLATDGTITEAILEKFV